MTSISTIALGDPAVAEIILGQSPPSSTYNESKEGLPFYQGKVDFGFISPTARVWCRGGRQFARKGDVLVSVRAPVGDVNLATEDCAIGRGIAAVRANRDVDPWFLFFAMQHVRPVLAQQATGTTFANVNKATLAGLRIPAFSLDCQKSLSMQLRYILSCIETEQMLIDAALQLKRATMRELFSRGLRGEAQKETEIGLLPESWSAVPFEAALTIAQGQVDPKVEPYASLLNIGPENVEPNTGRLLICQTAKDLGLISGKYHFRAGDIIYSKIRPYLNKVVMPTFEGVCSSDMYPLRAATGFESRFLFHYLLSEFFLRQAVPHQLRTGIPRINHAQLADTAFPKPPFADQRAIIEILDAIDSKIDLHHRKRAVLEELFKSLLHKLMTGEIRVDQLNLAALDAAQRQEVIP